MYGKFGLSFLVFSREQVEQSRTGNPFDDHELMIARLDQLSRNEDLSAEDLALDREAAPRVVVEPEPPLARGLLEDVVLGAQILGDLLLLPVDQAGQDGEEKLSGLQNASHGWSDAWRHKEEHRPPGPGGSIARDRRRA
jgi:hypothetical protein